MCRIKKKRKENYSLLCGSKSNFSPPIQRKGTEAYQIFVLYLYWWFACDYLRINVNYIITRNGNWHHYMWSINYVTINIRYVLTHIFYRRISMNIVLKKIVEKQNWILNYSCWNMLGLLQVSYYACLGVIILIKKIYF